jgi:hypothetical protein
MTLDVRVCSYRAEVSARLARSGIHFQAWKRDTRLNAGSGAPEGVEVAMMNSASVSERRVLRRVAPPQPARHRQTRALQLRHSSGVSVQLQPRTAVQVQAVVKRSRRRRRRTTSTTTSCKKP